MLIELKPKYLELHITVGKSLTPMKKKVLFLIRAYNDMDHFVPIMWKAAKEGYSVYYFFVDSWRARDYRKNICDEVGAVEIRSKLIAWYHYKLKEKIKNKSLIRIFDGVFCIVVGGSILIRWGVNRLVVEWCGPSGREMGRYLLVAGRLLRIRTVSMPHGYHIWRNKLVTWEMVRNGSKDARYDFSERNRFYRYIVQSENIQQYFLDRKIGQKQLAILGSARFSEDWAKKNLEIALSEICASAPFGRKPFVVFFLGNWNYRVNKNCCMDLLLALSQLTETSIIVKGHSRGDLIGGLDERELSKLSNSKNITYSQEATHSNVLIYYSSGIINFGSSIALEAVVQGKPICNASYLTQNETIFTNSKVVYDASNEEEVVDFVRLVLSDEFNSKVTPNDRSQFLVEHVYGGNAERNVLSEYVQLFE